jgi:hypothetical protein
VKIQFHPAAELEFAESALWYDRQISGLGKDFVKAVDDGLQKIISSPFTQPIIYKSLRRFVIKRFPFIILYTITNDSVLVVAVFHTKRSPLSWKKRM